MPRAGYLWKWLRCSGPSSPPGGNQEVLGTVLWGSLTPLLFPLWDYCPYSCGGGSGWALQSRGCPWVSICLPPLSIPWLQDSLGRSRAWLWEISITCLCLSFPTTATGFQFDLQSSAEDSAISQVLPPRGGVLQAQADTDPPGKGKTDTATRLLMNVLPIKQRCPSQECEGSALLPD